MRLKPVIYAAIFTGMILGFSHAAKAHDYDRGHGFISFGFGVPGGYYAPPPPVYYAPPPEYYAPQPTYYAPRYWGERHHHEDDDDDN